MEKLKCPKCGEEEKQHKVGFTKAGSQRYRCFKCKKDKTVLNTVLPESVLSTQKVLPKPKDRRISNDIREAAIKMLLNGSSGRQVGKYFNMHHENVLRWAIEEAKKKD